MGPTSDFCMARRWFSGLFSGSNLWYPTYRWRWGCEALSLSLEKAKNSRSNRNKSSSYIVHLKQCKRQAAHKETSTLPGGCRKRTQGKQNLQGSCGQSRKNQVRKSEMKLCSGNPCDAGTKEPTEAQARPKQQDQSTYLYQMQPWKIKPQMSRPR